MKKLADFIVNKRKIILILFLILIVYCVWGMSKVNIEYSIESYLPQNTDTRMAIDIMDKEFTTFGTTTIMLRNISYSDASKLHKEIEILEGVKSFEFKNTPSFYKNSCALFNITFDGDDEDEISVNAYNETVKLLEGQDLYISIPLVDSYADDLQSDINFVLIVVLAIIIVVLLFTSKSFAEVIVFLIIFGIAALLNMGTNYWFGTISFISNSVSVILQLALAIDYAIILSHRFDEEKEKNGVNAIDAMKTALAKAIPEISGSSLTTISGLIALTTMALRLGADLGFVLAKSIVFSMLTVFLFMPAIMLMFSKAIEKTKHRSFVPKVKFIGKINVKLRYIIPVVFLVTVSFCTYFSFQADYAYTQNNIDTNRPDKIQIAKAETEQVFGYSNQFVILMKGKDYDSQKAVLDMVEAHDMISEALGISNTEITLNNYTYTLTERINYKQFALLLGTDNTIADNIFGAYAFLSQDDTRTGFDEVALYNANKDIYTASLIDICDCAFSKDDFIYAYLYNNSDALEKYEELRDTIQDAEIQLNGENYCRLIFNIDGAEESEATFALITELISEVKSVYPDAIFAGNSMSAYDLNQSFTLDNIKVSLLTIIFVFIILMFNFKSWGLPIPLTLTIQSAIFINFSYFALTGTNVFFFVYLIVSAIQMGATIDYAIVLTNRYQELKKDTDKKEAMIEAINQAFPTIITSGTIMLSAGFLIGGIVGNPLIATLGVCLGRGVVISIVSVLFVLPTLLLIFDKPLSKTMFKDRPKRSCREGIGAKGMRIISSLKNSENLKEDNNDEKE